MKNNYYALVIYGIAHAHYNVDEDTGVLDIDGLDIEGELYTTAREVRCSDNRLNALIAYQAEVIIANRNRLRYILCEDARRIYCETNNLNFLFAPSAREVDCLENPLLTSIYAPKATKLAAEGTSFLTCVHAPRAQWFNENQNMPTKK